MDFAESVKYLYSLGNEVEAMKLGLDNIHTLLHALGSPHEKYLKVQVAGTNGKGSVCAFLGSICHKAGIKTGVYTSPHLISITERVRIAGHDISEHDFSLFATRVRETSEMLAADGRLESVPTFFEQVTAIGLLAFAEAKIELAILETGLGGRLDATTAANAEIVAITSISIDHQEYLGETLAEIAAEKAAIIRGDSKVVIAEQDPEVMEILRDRCAAKEVLPNLAASVITTGGRGWLQFRTVKSRYRVEKLGLRGRHQIRNAKVALLLAEHLQGYFPFTKSKIVHGLESARHAGRLEFQGRYLFDGAHNVAGATALREFLNQHVYGHLTIIFGAMEGKNVGEIAEVLFPAAENIILTRPDNSRAMSADDLAVASNKSTHRNRFFLTENVSDAIAKAREIAVDNSIIRGTGSLSLVGEAEKVHKGHPKFVTSNLKSKIGVCTN